MINELTKIAQEEVDKFEVKKFIEKFGNPINNKITLFQKIFYPRTFFYIREWVYYYEKCRKDEQGGTQ